MNIVVNFFFSGPCGGKSTIAAELFAKMKWQKYNVELLHEYAKHNIYEENKMAIELQFGMGFQQLYNQMVMMNKVDVIICDSPFVLSNVYNTAFPHLNAGFVKEFKKHRNLNYLLVRENDSYTEEGRIHTYEEALELDKQIKNFLDKNQITYKQILSNTNTADLVLKDIELLLT
jgi:nicotinamide riboside kinase